MRRARMLSGAVSALLALAAPATGAAIRQGGPPGGRPSFDARTGARTPVPAAVARERHALAERLGIEAHVATDPVGGGLRVLDRTDGFLSGPQAGDPADVALAYVRAHATVFGLDDAQIAALRLVARYTSGDGVTHLTWMPESEGVLAYDSELNVHVTADGRIVSADGPPLGGLAIASAVPQLSAGQALGAARHDVGAAPGFPAARTRSGAARRTTFANGDAAHLVAFDAPGGDRLAWDVTVAGVGPYVYDEAIDARTGAVLARRSLTDFASNAHVFDYHPGAAAGGTARLVDLSPWLTSSTVLQGPNAHAYADVNNDDTANAGEEIAPSSGTNWDFAQQSVAPGGGEVCSSFSHICTWDGATAGSEATNRAQATTQLFYDVNNFHDWLEQPAVGFNAASRNFEGADPVHAEADDSVLVPVTNPPQDNGPFFNNANMSTLPDGQSPRMQMYLFLDPFPAVNGADDASVVYHEYTHGLSNRLVGNGNGLNGNQPGAMGEGWSDWYAMDYLVANGFVTDTAADGQVVVGEYATDDAVRGIRTQPLDCSVGSVASACAGTTTGGAGGYTYADLGRVGAYNATTPRFEVHDDGEIWSETLWDLRKTLGANVARRLITDGMRLSPLDPSFLDERDAILAADQADFSGAHHAALWQLFANRGMGFGARTTSANATRADASFATPTLASAGTTALDDAAPLGDGDGIPETGEALRLRVTVANPGLVALTHVHGQLTSATPGVLVGVPSADYGTIPAGGSLQDAAPFAISLGAACGTQVALTLHVTSDQGAIDLPVKIDLGSGRATFSSTDGVKAIPDGVPTSTAASSSLTIPTAGRIDHLRVTVNIANHAFVGDLTAVLTSPSGTKVTLLERPGFGEFGSDKHWVGAVTFDDAAPSGIQEIGDGGTLTGPYFPDQPLSDLVGQSRAGAWTLRITDSATPDTSTLNGWSLDTDQPACSTSAALPLATTGSATRLGASGATLGGSVDAKGLATSFRFDYGRTAAYGSATAVASAGSGAGAVADSAAVAGLAAGTTYHFRIVALRDGIPVAFGADRTFTTSTGGSFKPSPRLRVSGATRRATLSKRHRFTFAFLATPAGAHGTISFTIPKHRRHRAIAFGKHAFTVPANGHVKIRVTVKGKALTRLRQLHTAKVTVKVSLGGKTFKLTLRLSVPRPHHHRR